MLVRHFHDQDHSHWRVWAVHPAGVGAERRRLERRVTPAGAVRLPPLVERRSGADRRAVGAVGAVSAAPRGPWSRHVLPQAWQGGWLVFERDADPGAAGAPTVRRLAPIPADWDSCPECDLAEYLATATRRARRRA